MLGLVETHDFVFLLDTQTDGLVEDESDDQGNDEGIGTSCHNSDQLNHKLFGIAGQQTGSADSCKDTGYDGAEGTADTVYTEGIQGIVIFQLGFEQDTAVANQTCSETHQQGSTRLYETSGGGDDNQTGNDTGTETECPA